MVANRSIKDLAVTRFSGCGHMIQSISRSWKDGDGRQSRVRTRGVMGAVLDKVCREAFLWASEERPKCSEGENHAVLREESILDTPRRPCRGPQGRRPGVCEHQQDGDKAGVKREKGRWEAVRSGTRAGPRLCRALQAMVRGALWRVSAGQECDMVYA